MGKRMLLVHTPKCGGSYINKTFGKRRKKCPSLCWKEARGHKTYLEYRDIFKNRGDDIERYLVFSIIRNPWDWHLSWYNYIANDHNGRKSGMVLEHEQIKDLSFSEYISWLSNNELPRSETDYARRQVSDWLVDEDGKIANIHVIRQENLERELSEFCEEHGLHVTIPRGERINASREADDYRKFYCDGDVEKIYHRHKKDIELFGYEFE